MYLYLYDHFLQNKKYSGLISRIETRLTDLGIGGKIFRLSPLRNLKELIGDEIRNGVKTIVAVGGDKTLSEIINVVAKDDVTIGFIPVNTEGNIGKILGLLTNEAACEVIAGRIVEKIDLGKINGTYFLAGLEIRNGSVTLECNGQYRVSPNKNCRLIGIYNLPPLTNTNLGSRPYFNPQDGFLEILIQPTTAGPFKLFRKIPKESIIPFKQLTIKGNESTFIVVDGHKILKTPLTVEVVPKKLRIIVGKKRLF